MWIRRAELTVLHSGLNIECSITKECSWRALGSSRFTPWDLKNMGKKETVMPHLDLNHLSAKSRYEKYYIDAFTEQIHLDTRRDN